MRRQREQRKCDGERKFDEVWQRKWVLGRQLNSRGKITQSPGLRIVIEETQRLNQMPHNFQEIDSKVMDAVGGKREYLVPDNKEKFVQTGRERR